MATGHWFTNRGKLKLMQGVWDDAGATAIKCGLVKLQPAGVDTAAEVADLDTVADLLVTAGATECDFTNYARKDLTRTNWAESDANDRVDAVAALLTWSSAGGASNNTIYGAFFYDATDDSSDSTRLLLSVDWFASTATTNGGDFRYDPSAAFYRAS